MSDQQPPPERPTNPYGPADPSDPEQGSFGAPPPPANPYGTRPSGSDAPAPEPTEQPTEQPVEQPVGQPAAPSPYAAPSYGVPPGAAVPPSSAPPSSAPPPSVYGEPPAAPDANPYGAAPPAYGGATPAAYGATPQRDPDARPGTVTAAAIITIVLSVIAGLLSGVGLIGLLAARDTIVSDLGDEPELSSIDGDQIILGVLVVLGVVLVWCVGAIVLSVLMMRRSNAARITLVVSSAVTLLVSLLAILSVVSVVPLVAAIAVLVLLFTGGAKEWFARTPAGPVGGPPAGY